MLSLSLTYKVENQNWDNCDAMNLKSCKLNILTKSDNHFNSKGQYYSFVNKSHYGVNGVSSLITYARKNAIQKI